MKKIFLLSMITISLLLLSGCGALREKILAPPDEMTIPEGSLVAECTVDDDVFKHIYKDDGIYQYFINDILQDESKLDVIQEQAYLNGESMDNYLNITYNTGECVITDYYED